LCDKVNRGENPDQRESENDAQRKADDDARRRAEDAARKEEIERLKAYEVYLRSIANQSNPGRGGSDSQNEIKGSDPESENNNDCK
jgi:hypothetical protein